MAIPIGAIIALAPQIIGAIKSIAGKGKDGPVNPKVKAGGIAGIITMVLLFAVQLVPDAPKPPPGIEAALVLVVAYIAAWIKAIPAE